MDLKVKIPKRYKNTLSKRFNPKYKEYQEFYEAWTIPIHCPLCGIHMKDGKNCNNCPFIKFGNSTEIPCNKWMENIYRRKKRYWNFTFTCYVAFENKNKSKAIKSLNWFRDRVEELIEWI